MLGTLRRHNYDNRVEVAAIVGVEAVLAGMDAHKDAEGVQEAGCGALRNLCLDAGTVRRMKAKL